MTRAAAPVTPADLRRLELLAELSEERLEWLAAHGERRFLAAGEALYENEPIRRFTVLLDGEIESRVELGGDEFAVHVHRPVTFLGAVSLLTGQGPRGSGHASLASEVVTFDAETFEQLVRLEPEIARRLTGVIGPVYQRVERLRREREKLAALGGMAAGLAHEINNPAAAVASAGADLRGTLALLSAALPRLAAAGVEPSDLERLVALNEDVLARAARPATIDPLGRSDTERVDPLERADREDGLAAWLAAHDVPRARATAEALVDGGLGTDWAEEVASTLPARLVPATMAWLAAGVGATALLDQVQEGTRRISRLVGALREHTFMDQAPEQEVDLHRGLESTLTLVSHRLKEGDVRVVRDYDQRLPRVMARGADLNQVWLNLVDNALDALDGAGTLTLHTAEAGPRAVVEVRDDGPGIPADIQSRVWEPFFTTKDVGQGAGLGLEMAWRVIVERHGGELSLVSRPGDTRVRAVLPVGPPG